MNSLATISAAKLTSKSAAKLSKDAVDLIAEIRALEAKFNNITADAVQFGVEKRKEGEGDLDLLARIAKAANNRAHEIAAEEDAATIQSAITSNSQPKRKGLAGVLDRAADAVAKF